MFSFDEEETRFTERRETVLLTGENTVFVPRKEE
jgi:hypothetical protein